MDATCRYCSGGVGGVVPYHIDRDHIDRDGTFPISVVNVLSLILFPEINRGMRGKSRIRTPWMRD